MSDTQTPGPMVRFTIVCLGCPYLSFDRPNGNCTHPQAHSKGVIGNKFETPVWCPFYTDAVTNACNQALDVLGGKA